MVCLLSIKTESNSFYLLQKFFKGIKFLNIKCVIVFNIQMKFITTLLDDPSFLYTSTKIIVKSINKSDVKGLKIEGVTGISSLLKCIWQENSITGLTLKPDHKSGFYQRIGIFNLFGRCCF